MGNSQVKSTPRDQIREVKELKRFTQRELAALLGVETSRIKSIANGRAAKFTTEEVLALVGRVHVSPDWLLTGEGQVFLDDKTAARAAELTASKEATDKLVRIPVSEVLRSLARDIHLAVHAGAEQVKGQPKPGGLEQNEKPMQRLPVSTIDGFILVPKVAARLSLGGGSWEVGAEIRGHYAFRADWLRAKGRPEDMVLMEVSGNSMEPELLDGDTVLINQGQTDILAGRIYAVGIEDTAVAKRVERRPGTLILRSSNPSCPPIEIDMRGDLADTVRIIGRVIWWGHEER